MKYAVNIAGALLGLMFIAFSSMFLFKLVPIPEPVNDGTPASHFMLAFMPTGYTTFVKVLELLGGILVAIPLTRNIGLLVLGPIIVNILAFHTFIMPGTLVDPILIAISLLALFLLWAERKAFLGLIRR